MSGFAEAQSPLALSPPPSLIARMAESIAAQAGLNGTDLANIADVSKATVSRWKAGTARPTPSAQLLLADLHYLAQRLAEFYTPEEARLWLYAPHPQLEGQRAMDLLRARRTAELLTILDRLEAEAYL